METYDDELSRFEADGAAPLPDTNNQGFVEQRRRSDLVRSVRVGSPVILLHGGLGHSGNWGYQVPALVRSGYRAVVIDSRGHGRSTRDARPFTYELMASDVLAVMDALHIEKAASGGLERRRVHSIDPCFESSRTGCRRVFLCLQYGPERHKGIRIHSDYRALYQPAHARLRTAIGHAGPIRRVFRGGRPDAENATQLFGG